MMELVDDVHIRCDCCGKEFYILKGEFDIEYEYYDHGENGMGVETEYWIEQRCYCPSCNNVIGFRIAGFEYPPGAYNYENNEIHGGRFTRQPQMGIVFPLEEFDCPNSQITHTQQLILAISREPNLIYEVSPREFEEIIEQLFIDDGFETQLTRQTRDGGKDIIATKVVSGIPIVFYIECKKYGKNNVVDINVVRSLYGVQMADRINKSILVTTGRISSDAKRFVREQNSFISYIEPEQILRMIRISAAKYR